MGSRLLGAIATAALILLLCTIVGCGAPQSPTEQHNVGLPFIRTPQPSMGIPALKPPVTLTEAEDFARTHPLLKAIETKVEGAKAKFMTSKEVTALTGLYTGLPGDTLLCYVDMKGHFIFTGPPGTSPVSYSEAYEVFIVSSGNLLIEGAVGKP